jgi:hypothetical protein
MPTPGILAATRLSSRVSSLAAARLLLFLQIGVGERSSRIRTDPRAALRSFAANRPQRATPLTPTMAALDSTAHKQAPARSRHADQMRHPHQLGAERWMIHAH